MIDGSKRTCMAVMLLILRRNGVRPVYEQQELVAPGLSVTQGSADVSDTLAWIIAHQIV